MARPNYEIVADVTTAQAKAIAQIEKCKSVVDGKNPEYSNRALVITKADDNNIFIINVEKVKYAMPEFIATMDLAIQGKSMNDFLSEEARKYAGIETAKYFVNKEVLKALFTAKKLKMDAYIEYIYSVVNL